MKKQDFLFIFVLVIIFLPFFVSESIYNWIGVLYLNLKNG